MSVEVELVLQAIQTYLYEQLDQLSNKSSNNTFNSFKKKSRNLFMFLDIQVSGDQNKNKVMEKLTIKRELA